MAKFTSYPFINLWRPFIIIIVLQFFTYNKVYGQQQRASSGINYKVNRQMQWQYGGYEFTLQLSLDESTYNYYKGLSKKEPQQNYAQELNSHPYLLDIASQLDEDAKTLGYTGFQMVEYLTAFVQQTIKYQPDPYNNGWDYPKYPIETLMEKVGDCEDSAALLVALLKTFGFDAVFILLPRHMAVGIACENCTSYYNYNGKRYAYIETTNANWHIGTIPTEYIGISASLIKTTNLPKYNRNQPYMPAQIDEIEKITAIDKNEEDCTCPNSDLKKTITIDGVSYTVSSNQSVTVTINGVKVKITKE